MTQTIILAVAIGYFLGSIPFGLLLTRMGGKGDIRAIGSGNIGATNVLRTGSKKLAAATLLLDALKGTAAVLLAHRFLPGGGEVAAAAGAMIGHLYPVWLKFRGGKGVATFLGVLAGLTPAGALMYAIVWIGLLLTVRISSVAGMAAAASAPIVAAIRGDATLYPLLVALAILVIWKHRDNIRRLRAGEEPRIGSRRA